jgi:hypothetical protein
MWSGDGTLTISHTTKGGTRHHRRSKPVSRGGASTKSPSRARLPRARPLRLVASRESGGLVPGGGTRTFYRVVATLLAGHSEPAFRASAGDAFASWSRSGFKTKISTHRFILSNSSAAVRVEPPVPALGGCGRRACLPLAGRFRVGPGRRVALASSGRFARRVLILRFASRTV